MAVLELIMEVVFQTIFETLPKVIGVSIKWILYLGKKPTTEIKKESWNTRIGFLVLMILFVVLYNVIK